MKHPIDPKIDCVFKALLGSDNNRNLLLHFLNAILGNDLPQPIVAVEILNPYNDKEHLEDKLSIVDVKARDDQERLYQIEIQLLNFPNLPERILYNWADIYSQQLQNGEDYGQLKPTYAIWLLAENLIKADRDYLHTYQLKDRKGRSFNDHCGIWLIELKKFSSQRIENEQQRWLQFFKDGEQLIDDNALPDWMATNEMRQAMNTLRQFSDKERDYHAYQSRQEFIRQQNTLLHSLEKAQREKQQAEREKQQALRQSQQAERDKQQALKQSQQAEQEKQQAEQEKQQAQQESQQAQQEKQAALLEIERLKALLNGQEFN